MPKDSASRIRRRSHSDGDDGENVEKVDAPSRKRPAKGLPSTDAVVAHRWNEHREDDSGERFRAGRWTPAEDERLLERFDEYCGNNNLSGEDRLKPILDKVKSTDLQDVWAFLAEGFETRTIRAVMRRAKRLLHPGNRQGELAEEEQALLLRLVERRGPRWEEIGRLMNRFPLSLATQYTRLSAMASGTANSGPWSSAEEAALVAYIERYGTPVPGGGYASIPWSVISAEMRCRTPGQCLLKWSSGGFGMRKLGLAWDPISDRELVDAVVEDGGETAAEVPWARLMPGRPGPDCRRRFEGLSKRLPRHAQLSFAECVAELARDLRRTGAAALKGKGAASSASSSSSSSSSAGAKAKAAGSSSSSSSSGLAKGKASSTSNGSAADASEQHRSAKKAGGDSKSAATAALSKPAGTSSSAAQPATSVSVISKTAAPAPKTKKRRAPSPPSSVSSSSSSSSSDSDDDSSSSSSGHGSSSDSSSDSDSSSSSNSSSDSSGSDSDD